MYNQEYLENLIKNGIEESLSLEYKSSPSLNKTDQKKINEIAKDVSAFANADGGILIYGIQEKDHLPLRIDPINRSLVKREWLEQKIQDCIRPKIDKIKIYPITIDSNNDQVVYLLEIPKSTTAHQASDKKYYRRHNFNVLAMYDHEIRDVFNRTKHPKINLKLEVWVFTYKSRGAINPLAVVQPEAKNVTEFHLKIFAENTGKVLANYINCSVEIPEVVFEEKFRNGDPNFFAKFEFDNKVRDILDVEIQFQNVKEKLGPARFEPILPTRSFRLDSSFPKLHEFYKDYADKEINWTVYADNSEPHSGSTKIGEITVEYKKYQ
jgi:hypothetical protein